MEVRGETIIGRTTYQAKGPTFSGYDPASMLTLEPAFGSSTPADLERACALAEEAFAELRSISPEVRAQFLEAIAANLEAAGDAIVARARSETGLPEVRLRGELGRTTGQLRLFARVVREGDYLDVRIDHALHDRAPPRPDVRLTNVPLGPVAVFGASNFPLAFSVAGGDTASALAAGCPVVVKAHSAHPGTSELAGRAIRDSAVACGLPSGTFSLLFDAGTEIGGRLVADSRIAAVGFTGSRAGGLALMEITRARPRPIPVYAEMSSINPVLLLPGALAERGRAIGAAFTAAQMLGAGQFCTNPGLILAIDATGVGEFVAGVRDAYADAIPAPMLTSAIHRAYCAGVAALSANPLVHEALAGREGGELTGSPRLFEAQATDFLADRRLAEEVFGAASLLVRCADAEELEAVLCSLEGQLTVSVHAAAADMALAARLMPLLERRAGRILFNGFGTGVEVCDAMVHGGPYPATSDGRSTSVGSLAIMRFVRPVSFQDVPAALLPPSVRDENPLEVPQRVDGRPGGTR